MDGFMLVLTLLIFLIPESPKFLVAEKRYNEARAVLVIMARMNGS